MFKLSSLWPVETSSWLLRPFNMTPAVFDSLPVFQNDKMFNASHSFLAQNLELAIFLRNPDFFQW